MSKFTDLLNKYIERNKLTRTSAAEYLGISRTTLQHILSGNRSFKDYWCVKEVGEKLMLTSDELNEFLNEYRISDMGAEVYNRRVLVAKIISQMSQAEPIHLDALSIKQLERGKSPVMTACDNLSLKKILKYVLVTQKPELDEIFLVAQPSDFINEIIVVGSDENPNCRINHVFCADNEFNSDKYNKDNLESLYYSFVAAISSNNYSPYYYYDNISSHINTNSLFPNLLVAGEYVVSFNSDCTYGIAFQNAQAAEFYKKTVQSLIMRSSEIFTPLESNDDLISLFLNISDCQYEYFYQPCLLVAAPPEMLLSNVRLENEQKARFMSMVKDFYPSYINSHPYNFFCEEGLREFMRTGVVYELPQEVYVRPMPEGRVAVLERMISMLENDVINYCIFRDSFRINNSALNIHASRKQIKIFFTNSSGRLIALNVNEPGLIFSFADYFDYISTSDVLYSKEETLVIFRKILDEYKRSL